ncbi:MAG: hypothetical protein WD872_01275 [Pirellulaceae bacterium]
MSRSFAWQMLACGLVLLCSPLASAGDDAGDASAKAIASLLDFGWTNTPAARAAADAQYEVAKKLPGSELAVLKASLLVLMQQRRYDDALARADELLAKDAADTSAWRAKIWLAALTKNYAVALLAADSLSEQLAAESPTTDERQAQHDELIEFQGRIFGFLGGPAARSVNQDQRKEYERRVLDRIPESRRLPFELARDAVVQKYLELSGEKEDERDKAVAAGQAEKEKSLKELEDEGKEISERAKELNDQEKKVQGELRDELGEIGKADRPLVQELSLLSVRAGALRRDLTSYAIQIGRLRNDADATEDFDVREQLLRDADRLGFFANRIESDLVSVNRLADAVGAERAALAGRQLQAQSAAVLQVRRIEQERSGLLRRDKRNEGIARRTSRSSVPASGKARVLAAQATALTTYEEFPLEGSKAELLESLP